MQVCDRRDSNIIGRQEKQNLNENSGGVFDTSRMGIKLQGVHTS